MKRRKVVVAINNGTLEAIKIPKNVKLIIRDYGLATDQEGRKVHEEMGNLKTDALGREFVESVLTKKDLASK